MDNQQLQPVTNICQPKKIIHLKSSNSVLNEREQRVENAINAIMTGTSLLNVSGNLTDTTLTKKSGIYLIVNKLNGKWYVGSAKNFRERIREGHLYRLKKNIHENSYLQNSWHKYGVSAFIFIELEYSTSSRKNLYKVEAEYLIIAKRNRTQSYNVVFAPCHRSISMKYRRNASEAMKLVWKSSTYNKDRTNTRGKLHWNYVSVDPKVYNILKICYYQHGAVEMAKLAKIKYGINQFKSNSLVKEYKTLNCNIPQVSNPKNRWIDNDERKRRSERFKDRRIFTFKNNDTGESFTGLRYDFCKKYNLRTQYISPLLNGKRKYTFGWFIQNINNIQ